MRAKCPVWKPGRAKRPVEEAREGETSCQLKEARESETSCLESLSERAKRPVYEAGEGETSCSGNPLGQNVLFRKPMRAKRPV